MVKKIKGLIIMILEKIIKIFKKEDIIKLYDQRDIVSDAITWQYISSGCVCYLLENLPIFNDRTLPALLGEDPERATANYSETDVPEWLQKVFTPRPTDDDIPLKDSGFEMFEYTVFRGDEKNGGDPDVCVFLDKSYLAPFNDKKEYDFYYRSFRNDIRAVVVMDGFIVQAVIMPIIPSGEKLARYKNFASLVYTELCRIESAAPKKSDSEENDYVYEGEL